MVSEWAIFSRTFIFIAYSFSKFLSNASTKTQNWWELHEVKIGSFSLDNLSSASNCLFASLRLFITSSKILTIIFNLLHEPVSSSGNKLSSSFSLLSSALDFIFSITWQIATPRFCASSHLSKKSIIFFIMIIYLCAIPDSFIGVETVNKIFL